MAHWEVEYTDEFETWWLALSEAEQESLDMTVRLLEAKGPSLGYPHTSPITTSRHAHMRELRTRTARCMHAIPGAARSC